jgi:hypothetical protein
MTKFERLRYIMTLLNSGKLLIHPALNNDVSKVLESCVNLLDIKLPGQTEALKNNSKKPWNSLSGISKIKAV